MKGKINKKGELEIKRAGKFKLQECRSAGAFFVPDDGYHSPSLCTCSDDCLHFGELEKALCSENHNKSLQVCQGKILYFDEFEDERE
jgi:hypothetical protein